MRCPACQTENEKEASRCVQCGTGLAATRSRRTGPPLNETPFTKQADESERDVLRAYRLTVWGLIPFVGLVLGPLGLVLAVRARPRALANAAFRAHGPLKASLILGSLITVTNWAGTALMIAGLMQGCS